VTPERWAALDRGEGCLLVEEFAEGWHFWEAVAQLELDRRGESELLKQRKQARCQHGRVFRDGDTCRACGKRGLP
jgi:hypothetical protein